MEEPNELGANKQNAIHKLHRQLKRRRRRRSTDSVADSKTNSKLVVDCDYKVLQCILFDSKGYVIYSAVGSFFIPMLVMIFFYWRIYLVAMYTTNAMNRGYISKKSFKSNTMTALAGTKNAIDTMSTVKYGSTNANNLDTNSETNSNLTLRVHRGYFKDQQLTTNLTNMDLNRRSTNRSSYDSTGRSSTASTTVTLRANSTVETTTAAQLCRRLLPTRLSNRLLSNNDAKKLRKIQHRSVRCLDRTQNIITLAADATKPRAASMLKRTQSEQCIELNVDKRSDVLKFDQEIKLNSDRTETELNGTVRKDDKCIGDQLNNNKDKQILSDHMKNGQTDRTIRVSNSEKNIANLQLKIKPHSLSSGNLMNNERTKFTFNLTKRVHRNSVQSGSQIQIQLNIVPPQDDKSSSSSKQPNGNQVQNDQLISADSTANEDRQDHQDRNGYKNGDEINNNHQQQHPKDTNLTDLIETTDTNCNTIAQPIPLSTSGSTRSKRSYWSRFSRKRTYLNRAPNQNPNNSGRFEKKRFLAETKAAKTVGIIVGCFSLCWFPFFTVYLTRGLCEDKNCIPDIILTLFTWLGYINSALVSDFFFLKLTFH